MLKSTKIKWILLSGIFTLLLAFAAGRRPAKEEKSGLPKTSGPISRVEIGQSNTYFTLEWHGSQITERDLNDGRSVRMLDTATIADGTVLRTADFTVDESGNVHTTLYCQDQDGRRFVAIRVFKQDGRTEDIRLDRLMDVGPLAVDADGNYLLLGLLEEQMSHLADLFRNGKSAGSEPLLLVHEFASDGRFIASHFARRPPSSFQDLTAFMAVFPQSSQILSLKDGRMYVLLMDKDPTRDHDPSSNALYKFEPNGVLDEIHLEPPGSGFVLDSIHRYGSELAVQWLQLEKPEIPASMLPPGSRAIVGLRLKKSMVEIVDQELGQRELLREDGDSISALGLHHAISVVYRRHLPNPGSEFRVKIL